MTLYSLALRNLARVPLRTTLTLLAVAICLVAFSLVRALHAGYTDAVAQTPNNRVVARHKVGWDQTLPVHYAAEVSRFDGVKHAMAGRWAGLRHPVHDTLYIDATAVDARAFAAMHYELVAPQQQKDAWVSERTGLMVSDELAARFGWSVGDTVHLKGTFFPGDFRFLVTTIYHSTRHGFAQRSVWLHWEYFNEHVPPEEKDRINIISAEIHDPSQGARIAKAIDIRFDSEDNQTFTQEDQALTASFVGMFGAILSALNVASILILGIVLLILGNTVAMALRERSQELGVMRAIGFGPQSLRLLVLTEAAALGLGGGLLGLALAFPVIEGAASRFVQESMDFQALRVPLAVALIAAVSAALLGALAAALPLRHLMRLEVVDALRHQG
jgi:putative ABC transport system permease protein